MRRLGVVGDADLGDVEAPDSTRLDATAVEFSDGHCKFHAPEGFGDKGTGLDIGVPIESAAEAVLFDTVAYIVQRTEAVDVQLVIGARVVVGVEVNLDAVVLPDVVVALGFLGAQVVGAGLVAFDADI